MAFKEPDFSERDLSGFKYLDRLLPMLAQLHDFGCARDRAGNRQLHFDQYCLLVLLALFNPVVRSLRAIQQASTLRKVQKPRTSLGAPRPQRTAAVAEAGSPRLTRPDPKRRRRHHLDNAACGADHQLPCTSEV